MRNEKRVCAQCKKPYTVKVPESFKEAIRNPLTQVCSNCGCTIAIGSRSDYKYFLRRLLRRSRDPNETEEEKKAHQRALEDKIESYEYPEALPEYQRGLKARIGTDNSHKARRVSPEAVKKLVAALQAENPRLPKERIYTIAGIELKRSAERIRKIVTRH